MSKDKDILEAFKAQMGLHMEGTSETALVQLVNFAWGLGFKDGWDEGFHVGQRGDQE